MELKFLSGPYKNANFTFTEYQKISIGRSKRNFFTFSETKELSRFHCLMEILPPNYCVVKDLESKSGTFLKSGTAKFEKVSRKCLQRGDCIKIGDIVLTVCWEKTLEHDTYCSSCNEKLLIEDWVQGRIHTKNGQHFCHSCHSKTKVSPGMKIGPFEIVNKLGEGGMGVVYLVRHKKSQFQFALKIIRPQMDPDEEKIQRFLNEAACAGSVKHKNIIQHYPAGYSTHGFFYIPMEYIEGVNLRQYIKNLQEPDIQKAKPLVLGLLNAVEHLHQNNILHRDIKPANVMVIENEVKLTDFGLAKNLENSGLSLTLSETPMGTLAYMAPEQCLDAKKVDFRADIYSLAATIYRLLTFRPVFKKTTFTAILDEAPIPIEQVNQKISSFMAEVIMKNLNKKPEQRHQTIEEFRESLEKAFDEV